MWVFPAQEVADCSAAFLWTANFEAVAELEGSSRSNIGIVLSFDEWQYIFDDLLAKCRRNPPCLTDVLMKPGNKHIEYEFNQTKGKLTDSEFHIPSFGFRISDFETHSFQHVHIFEIHHT